MSEPPKRLKQTHIFEEQAFEEEEEEEEGIEQLPSVDIYAKVYAYCEVEKLTIAAGEYVKFDPAVHGRPVYVGQTIQDLKERDKQHLRAGHSVFDRQYKDKGQYIMVLLAERCFAAAEEDRNFKDQTLHPAGAWMDHWETEFISKFDTYDNGFNRTKGGQRGGWLVAM